ncbi:MAG: gephyrin-like molybdotransferase Glp [Planctomycetaceae bacterium]
MLSVDDALAEIVTAVTPFEPQSIALADALGLFLAEDVVSDTDSPPFDKALMDGYAVRAADIDGNARLIVTGEVTAGRVPTRDVGPGEAIRIMTGAPMPGGADAVVRVEDTEFDAAASSVVIRVAAISPGDDMMPRAASMRAGERVLATGRQLGPQQHGALAELGRARVSVRRRPRIAILATGDELVPVGEVPGPGQIRNSNETMLAAQAQRAGADVIRLGIARDKRPDLRAKIQSGLEYDVLLLSGGVSAGTLDLVPSELEGAGVRQVFHRVKVKPGKPVWFGMRPAVVEGGGGPCCVFGLPGNPVSSMVCFELFARTAIRRLMGDPDPLPRPVAARLAADFSFRGDRPTYHPAEVTHGESGPVVRPVNWQGSADLRSTVETNGLALFPPGDRNLNAGERVDVLWW